MYLMMRAAPSVRTRMSVLEGFFTVRAQGPGTGVCLCSAAIYKAAPALLGVSVDWGASLLLESVSTRGWLCSLWPFWGDRNWSASFRAMGWPRAL